MTDELDKLRPEVRESLDKLGYFLTGTHNHNDFYTIRSELLRLAEDAAMFAHAVSLGQRYKQRAEHAEAELAALKARIAQAPVAVFHHRGGVSWTLDDGHGDITELSCVPVCLLVDEPAPAPEPGSLDELRIERGGSSHG